MNEEKSAELEIERVILLVEHLKSICVCSI